MGQEMKNNILKRGLVFGIFIVLFSTSIFPSIMANDKKTDQQKDIDATVLPVTQKTTSISVCIFGKTGLEQHDILLSYDDATQIHSLFKELKHQMAISPFNEKTQQTQDKFLNLLEEKHALPQGTSKDELTALLQPPLPAQTHPVRKILPFQNKASEWMCTFVSEGSGTVLPIIILPRLIPILLTPIPRAFVRWNVKEGFTSCGGLRSGTGFIAYGEQKGAALGFWGIGITFSLPPIMNTYGLIGYSLYASVTADTIDHYPPNSVPEITQTDPADGQQMVPLSTTELRFSIEDADKDLMSYNITTQPDIGSGSAGLKPDGIYSIPISGLEGLTQYTWHIQVSDGTDITDVYPTFITEPTGPIILDPSPKNGEREVSLEQNQLTFTLKDFQGKKMDYTVETSPNIGSGNGHSVNNGTYTVPIHGLENGAAYQWYVNVTDGTYSVQTLFAFTTRYPPTFNPFEWGWHYRKQITINHTKVSSDLTNFPVLLNTLDSDIRNKARVDGGDIVFMNGTGVATKLYHEIEKFDPSSDELVAWVNVSKLSSNNDTILYIYYGNPNCINMEYPEKTWDSSYIMVQHFDEISGTHYDSTFHHNDGISYGNSQTVSGIIDGANSFDGVNDYLDCGNSESVNPTNAITVEAWYRPVSFLGTGDDPIIDKGYYSHPHDGPWYQYHLGVRGDQHGPTGFSFYVLSGGTQKWVVTPGGFWIPGNWYHLVGTYDGSSIKLYANGALLDSKSAQGTIENYGKPVDIGKPSNLNTYLPGTIDEIRLSSISRSPHWISTEYANQNDPSGFLHIGPEDIPP